jgi:hypothetical protein
MAKLDPLTPDQILVELDLESYVAKPDERADLMERCRAVLMARVDHTYDHKQQVDHTLQFIRALWRKYDCEAIAEVYSQFIKFEEAMYGLERDEQKGERYRDHFVHMFNCFVFGLRLLSALRKQLTDAMARTVLKVKDENLKALGLPFSSNYSYKLRFFYLWTLAATFHDIAIPFQHLSRVSEGVNKYISEFGWTFNAPSISMRSFDSSQLSDYFQLLAKLYGGQFNPDGTNTDKYQFGLTPHAYVLKVLGREFDSNNHGVLSGFFMWKLIEEIFLLQRSAKYRLTMEQFDKYTEFILHQDIARAALAISLHSLKPLSYPNIFPVDFQSFPLTFLLVLSDELQEYLRWEGTSIRGDMKFNYQPRLTVAAAFDEQGALSTVNVTAQFGVDQTQGKYLIKQATVISDREKIGTKVADIRDAIQVIANTTAKTLRLKLQLGTSFRLRIEIYVNWEDLALAMDLKT